MTRSSLILAIAAGIAVVVLIVFGLTHNLAGVWWHGFWTGIMTMLMPPLGLLAWLLWRETIEGGTCRNWTENQVPWELRIKYLGLFTRAGNDCSVITVCHDCAMAFLRLAEEAARNAQRVLRWTRTILPPIIKSSSSNRHSNRLWKKSSGKKAPSDAA